MSSDRVTAAVAAYRAAAAELAGLDVEAFTHVEVVELLQELETVAWAMPMLGYQLIARLQREASPKALGAKTLKAVLAERLRISGKEAARRVADTTELAPRTTITGQPLPALREATAAAHAAGRIGPEHVTIISTFFAKLPHWVDPLTRDQCESDLLRIAVGSGPDELRGATAELAILIDQDGPEPDDTERLRKRAIHIGPQQPDGMSRITGWLTPEARATLEPIEAKLAAPGMCNPDDCDPCTSGTPSQAQIDADRRSLGQRTHDALLAVARTALASGELGQHNGLPVTVIATTTVQDLEKATGSAITAGGTKIPMPDLIRMAAHAMHYLAVFDQHTNEALYCGRSKRIAPKAHRIMLLARDHGCTKPGCPVNGYGTQVHHVTGWARHGGQTNIDEEVLACGADNRLAEDGWTVRIGPHGVEWIPPPELDVGQPRINYRHHPQRLLTPRDGDGPRG